MPDRGCSRSPLRSRLSAKHRSCHRESGSPVAVNCSGRAPARCSGHIGRERVMRVRQIHMKGLLRRNGPLCSPAAPAEPVAPASAAASRRRSPGASATPASPALSGAVCRRRSLRHLGRLGPKRKSKIHLQQQNRAHGLQHILPHLRSRCFTWAPTSVPFGSSRSSRVIQPSRNSRIRLP